MAIAKNQRVAAVGYNSTAPGGEGSLEPGVGTGYNGKPSRKPAGGGDGKDGKEGKEGKEGTADDTYGSVDGPPRLFGEAFDTFSCERRQAAHYPNLDVYGRNAISDSDLDDQLGRGRVLGGFSIFDVEHTPNAARKAASKTGKTASSAAPTTYHSAFDEAQPFTAPVYAVAFNPVQPVLYTAGGRMQEYVAEGAEHSSCEINAWRLAKGPPRVGGGGPRWSVEFMWSTTPPMGSGNHVSVAGALYHASNGFLFPVA